MSAAGAIGGSLVSGVASLVGGNSTNSAARANQASAEQFNEDMADTQYQRQVSDMKAAGLNPMLAAGAGGNAAPTIAPAPVVNALGSAMSAGITNYSALQSARQTDASIDASRTQANLNDALAGKAAADTSTALALTDKIKSGSWMSDVIGSTAASKASNFLNEGIDSVTNKASDLITGIKANSASALDSVVKWIDKYAPGGKTPGPLPSPPDGSSGAGSNFNGDGFLPDVQLPPLN